MSAKYNIVDADRHVVEPIEMWQEYLPPEFRSRAPYLEPVRITETPIERLQRHGARALYPMSPVLMMEGEPAWHKIGERAHIELSWTAFQRRADLAAATEPEQQLASMDRHGVTAAYLYPTFATYVVGIDTLDSALGTALARAYNDWLHDYCRLDPQRLRGVGLMSVHDPVALVEEAKRIADFGWHAVVLRPNPVKGRLLSDPAYEPFWAFCERASLAVGLHEGAHTRLPTAGADRFESHFALHACSHPMEQMMALLALIEGGVLERHPKLRVGLLESGCGWVPYWLHRLDSIEYENLQGEVGNTIKRKPSEYFRRQCFVALEPSEPLLPAYIDYLGAESLIFGTDFPHLDHDDGIVEQMVGLEGSLSEATVRKVLWDNPKRFYEGEATRSVAP